MDLTFKGLPTMCYKITWETAVSEFIKLPEVVVLMDLRGFSEERGGVTYEVDYLLNNISVDRVVFLVDSTEDHELTHRLVLDRWECLRVHSPNLALTAPEVQIYVSGEQDEQDVQGIFDQLIGAALSNARIQAALKT